MKLPSADEYIDIISEKTEELPMLTNFRFERMENGKRLFYKKSRQTIIFKATHNSKEYAVRFFLSDDPELFRRYQQVQDYLENKALSWTIPFEFLGEGYNPMLKMDWIDSLSLSQYLDLIIDDPSRISQLQSKLVTLHHNLEKNGIGHGNLNMKHIRLIKQGSDYVIKLIDYDSMFVPAFKGKDSFTSGTAGFQHPMRLASDFSETIDRFSFWVLITALEAFKTDASLWQNAKQNGFNKEEQILFTYRDLAIPKQSIAFQLLKRYPGDGLKFYSQKLLQFCNATTLDNIQAPELYEGTHRQTDKSERESLYAPKEVHAKPVESKQVKTIEAVIAKPVVHEENIVRTKEDRQPKTNGNVSKPAPKTPEVFIQHKETKKKPVTVLIVIAFLLVLAAAYSVWKNNTKPTNHTVAVASEPEVKTKAVTTAQKKPVFTSANISQFLFQLYHSYNKRERSSILPNYADKVHYYDAGLVNKNKLSDIIQDLFIKPAHYECNPDIKTLQFNSQGNNCTLTVNINETIKANSRSATENYSSKIEYIIDSSFKIKSEKNIE